MSPIDLPGGKIVNLEDFTVFVEGQPPKNYKLERTKNNDRARGYTSKKGDSKDIASITNIESKAFANAYWYWNNKKYPSPSAIGRKDVLRTVRWQLSILKPEHLLANGV